MINAETLTEFSEAYHVEKTIEVVANLADGPTRVRIEALRSLGDGHYSTKAYVEEHITAQPTYPQSNGKHDRAPEDFRVWGSYSLPWTHRNTADDALTQALGFLAEGIKK